MKFIWIADLGSYININLIRSIAVKQVYDKDQGDSWCVMITLEQPIILSGVVTLEVAYGFPQKSYYDADTELRKVLDELK